MSWVKLDDAMPHHPKVMAAGPQAFALDVAAIAYSNRFGCDGFIADSMLPAVLPCLTQPRKHAAKLTEVGRWHRDDDRGGWTIHDVHDYQPTAADQEKERAEARERMRRIRSNGKQRSGDVRANTQRTSGERSDDVRDPVPSRTKPKDKPLAPEARQRSRNDEHSELFSALVEVCGLQPPLTKHEGGRVGTSAKQLREIGATPDDVRERAKAYRKRYGEQVELTPTGLVSNWAQVVASRNGHRRAPPSPDACQKCGEKLSGHDEKLCKILAEAS